MLTHTSPRPDVISPHAFTKDARAGGAPSASGPAGQVALTVLHIRASPFLGSPEKLLLAQLAHLRKIRCRYVVAVFDEQPGTANDFVQALRDRECPAHRLQPAISLLPISLARAARIARHQRVSVICAHDYKSNVLAYLLGRILGLPTAAVFHGRTSHSRRIRLYEKLDDHLLRRFDAIIAVSAHIKEHLHTRGVPADAIRVVLNAIDPAAQEAAPTGVRREFHLAPTDPLVVFAGRLSREKGLDVLLDAAPIVLRSVANARFLLVGSGPDASSISSKITRLGLRHHVILPGFRADVGRFLSEADLCVLPSFTEGMPLLILEAFASRKPVVATRAGGIPELVEHGVTGLLVSPGYASGLAGAITELLTDRSRARQMGQAGYECVRARFGVDSQVEQYVSVFERLSRRC